MLGNPIRRPSGVAALATVISLVLVLAACGAPEASPTTAESPGATEPNGATEPSEVGGTFDAGFGEVTLDYIPERPYGWNFQIVDSFVVLGVEPAAYTVRRGEGLPPYLVDAGANWENAVQLGEPPSLEQLVSLEPDIIISDVQNDTEALGDIAPVFLVRSNSYQDAMDQLGIMGEIFGREQEAQAFIEEFESLLEETQSRIADEEPSTSMVIYPGAEPGVLGMWLDTSFTGSLIDAVGTDYALKASDLGGSDLEGDNASFAQELGLVQLGLEKVIQVDPDVLFVLGDEEFISGLAGNPAWSTLSAVQNDRIYTFDRNVWSRARGPIAARQMVLEARHALYPDVFPDE